MTRLDDLLGYDDGVRRTRRRRSPATRGAIWVVAALAVAYLVHQMLRGIYQVDAPLVYLASAALCMVALGAVLRRLGPPPLPASLRDAPPDPPALSVAEDGIRASVTTWSVRLEWTREDLKRFDQLVKPGLVDIVDERLRLVHGVSRAADPERAQAIVPGRLWSFIHEPATRNISPQEIATLVAQMEAL